MNELNIEDRDRYAAFSFSGECKLPALIELARVANDYCTTHEFRAVLVDLTPGSGTLEPLERFELGRSLASFWNRDVTLAAVPTESQIHPTRYGELVSQNRGVRVRSFTDYDKAERWLKAILASDG